jgi:hypothetical protein
MGTEQSFFIDPPRVVSLVGLVPCNTPTPSPNALLRLFGLADSGHRGGRFPSSKAVRGSARYPGSLSTQARCQAGAGTVRRWNVSGPLASVGPRCMSCPGVPAMPLHRARRARLRNATVVPPGPSRCDGHARTRRSRQPNLSQKNFCSVPWSADPAHSKGHYKRLRNDTEEGPERGPKGEPYPGSAYWKNLEIEAANILTETPFANGHWMPRPCHPN